LGGISAMTRNDVAKLFAYWCEGAEMDWKTHLSLAKSKHFGPSLFYLHLSLKKYLKALIVKQSHDQAPFFHNLVFLVGKIDIVVSEEMIEDLSRISDFNIGTRYPADVQKFYRTATREYVLLWSKKAEKIRKKLIAAIKQ
jgi:HEPN domain-containing protein